MDFSSSLMDKIGLLAPDWDPTPILQQITAPQNIPNPAQAPSSWSFMDPTGTAPAPVPIPGDPRMVQQGPLAGMPAISPPAPQGAAPLSPEQIAALQRQMPQGGGLPHPAGVSPFRQHAAISLQQLGLPQQPARPRKRGFADLFGRG